MGPLGLEAFPDGEWDCFGKMLANEAHYSSPQHDGNMFCATHDAGGNRRLFYSFDSHNSNFQHISSNSNISGYNVFIDHVPLEEKINSHGHCNKKPRLSKDVQHCMNNQKLDKNGNEAEETNGSCSSSSHTYTPEDDNASALSLKGKTKATDPQSLNARKRRERINERLRILQNLVPNGTKVDISSMLEEAVHYVKFLQLQIKLLSSDDLWMYAQIAYNGLDIVLNLTQKSSPPL